MMEISSVATAISNVMAKAGSIEKRGTNTFHNYAFATASDIMHRLQPLMAQEGLIIFQTEKERVVTADALLSISYEFTLAHKSGAIWPDRPIQTGLAAARNSKGSADDKAANKCHTAARKYFLLGLFQIPTGDYDDADAQEDRPAAPPATAPVAKPRPSAPPHDPVTGEIGPHAISVPADPSDKSAWVGWGGSFVAGIVSATAGPELEAWVTANAGALKACAGNAAAVYNRIHQRLQEQRQRLTPVEDVFGLAPLPEDAQS